MASDSYLKTMTKFLKDIDPLLYCGRNKLGVPCLFRKGKKFELVFSDDDMTLFNLVENQEYIFALTHNFKTNGIPVEWGFDRIRSRVREIDAWENEKLFEEMDKKNEAVEQSRARDRMNQTEAYLADNHRLFQRAFNDINTSSLSKSDETRRKRDRSLKYGNR